MAILEQEVSVLLNGTNVKHFENKGYDIPRVRNKWRDLTVPKGTKLLIKIEDLQENSNIEVTKICDETGCGKYIQNQKYCQIIKQRKDNDGKDCCWDCARIKRGINRRNNISYEKSLKYFAINNNMEYLLSEFSDKNEKQPIQLSFGTHTEVLWDCKVCISEYPMKVQDRTCGRNNCPYCAGMRVNHTNCLWTTHPEIAKLLKNPQRGHEINAGRNKKEDFVCSDCGFEQPKVVSNVVRNGLSCHRCGDGIKYPEKLMFNLLTQLGLDFKTQQLFDWSNKKIYDFFVSSLNCIIETHGEQHYIEKLKSLGRTLKEEQENDEYKMMLAKTNNIDNYIVIDCRKSELEFIKNNIIDSELSKLFDLSVVDWDKCNEYASNSNLLKEVCGLWNSGVHSTNEIGNIVKLSGSTVLKYLKRGTELSWCKYDPIEVQRMNGSNSGKNSAKPIMQLSMDGTFIKEWESITEAKRCLGINNISSVCIGKIGYKSAGGFKWMYLNDKLAN